jgi:beta-carotene 3-hydroxylase
MDVPLTVGVLLAILTVVFMEGVAWATHKWVMHGPLWILHESHHRPRTGSFERNDWFAVFGILISCALIFMGTQLLWGTAFTWLGIGFTLYGIIYFLFHDVLVHRRISHNVTPWSRYLRRIVQAHRLHHVTMSREGSVSFGFIYTPPVKQLVDELRDLRAAGTGRSHPRAITR